MRIVLASNNQGKIRELKSLLDTTIIELIPQGEFGIGEAEETASTFVENALLKARHACRASGMSAIADDSGLVVPALQGAPGVLSARYAGPAASSAANIEKLLQKLKSVPTEQRQAAFQCVLVYLRHEEDPSPLICQGSWEGIILAAPRGESGFGYDPIFGVTENQSAAELNLETKNQFSHRGQALRALVAQLSKES